MQPFRQPSHPLWVRLLAVFAFVCLTAASQASAATLTQSFVLKPGWNSIFLEVAPANPDPATVFAGLPIDQAWTYFPTRSTVQYLSNPAEGLFNVPGWNVYLPANSRTDAAALSDLKGIIGHQAYLIKNTSASAATLTVTGTATLQPIKWKSDAYTCTGLPLDAATTVRSGDFFAASTAHAGQARYQLDPSGVWLALTDTTALVPGQAYWIYTKGGSDFTAPLEVSFTGGGRTLDFGSGETARSLILRNRSSYATTVTLANSGSLPLSVEQFAANGSGTPSTWAAFGASTTRSIPANASLTLTIGLRRAGVTSDTAGLLKVSGGGVALNVPVAASLPVSAASGATLSFLMNKAQDRAKRSGKDEPAAITSNANAGLWVGNAELKSVSEANGSTPNTATATPAVFNLRFLVHVDNAGTARLLKDVTVMRQKTNTGNPTTPPPFVLVTDRTRLTDFAAPQTRDGAPFADRITTVGFDFTGNEVVLTGSFGTSLGGTVTVDRTLPTNPFKHRYHPDHDGLTAQYVDQTTVTPAVPIDQQEVWGVQRALQLTFDAVDGSNAEPSTGYSQRTGAYQETLSGVGSSPGLHKNAITVSGTFVIRRLNTIGQLNPPVQ